MNYSKKNIPAGLHQRDSSANSHIINSNINNLRHSSVTKTRNQNEVKSNNYSYLNIKNPNIGRKDIENKMSFKVAQVTT